MEYVASSFRVHIIALQVDADGYKCQYDGSHHVDSKCEKGKPCTADPGIVLCNKVTSECP